MERIFPVESAQKYEPKELPPHIRAYNRYTSRTAVGLGPDDYEKIQRNEDIATLPRCGMRKDFEYTQSETNPAIARLNMQVRIDSYTTRTEVRLCSEMLEAINADAQLPLAIRQEGLRQITERLDLLADRIQLMGSESAWNERGQQLYTALQEVVEKSGKTLAQVLASGAFLTQPGIVILADLRRKDRAIPADPLVIAYERAKALVRPPYTDLWLYKNHPEVFSQAKLL